MLGFMLGLCLAVFGGYLATEAIIRSFWPVKVLGTLLIMHSIATGFFALVLITLGTLILWHVFTLLLKN